MYPAFNEEPNKMPVSSKTPSKCDRKTILPNMHKHSKNRDTCLPKFPNSKRNNQLIYSQNQFFCRRAIFSETFSVVQIAQNSLDLFAGA